MRPILNKLKDEWSEFRNERRDKRKARRILDDYGFVRSLSARYQHWLILFGIPLVGLLISSMISWDANLLGPIGGWAVALTAAVLGVQQWRAARNEISLDRFYERLGVTNRHLDDYEKSREFAGPWRDDTGQRSVYSEENYERSMYVYRELDNLEYAITKYKIGFMSSPTAFRALNTFKARCEASLIFCRIVENCADRASGYDYATKDVVAKCVAEAYCKHEGK